MFNIQKAKVEKRKFTREGTSRGQSYKFKYRARDTKEGGHDFSISDALFTAVGLDKMAAAIVPSYDDNGTVDSVGIVILPEDHPAATFFQGKRSSNKVKKFSNSLLEEFLAEAGIINPNVKGSDQKLDFQKWENNINIDEAGNIEIDSDGYDLYIIVQDGEETNYEDNVEEVPEEVVE